MRPVEVGSEGVYICASCLTLLDDLPDRSIIDSTRPRGGEEPSDGAPKVMGDESVLTYPRAGRRGGPLGGGGI